MHCLETVAEWLKDCSMMAEFLQEGVHLPRKQGAGVVSVARAVQYQSPLQRMAGDWIWTHFVSKIENLPSYELRTLAAASAAVDDGLREALWFVDSGTLKEPLEGSLVASVEHRTTVWEEDRGSPLLEDPPC